MAKAESTREGRDAGRYSCMQRITRMPLGLAAVAGIAAALLVPLAASAVVVTTTLSLSPTHGVSGNGFTATYTLAPCQTVAGTTVDFYWNGHPPDGGQKLGSAPTDQTCTARLTTAVPQALKAGGYIVYGFIPLPDGTPTNGTTAAAVFTVDTSSVQPSASGAAAGASGATAGTGAGTGTKAGASSKSGTSQSGTAVTSPFGLGILAALVIGGLLGALLALLAVVLLGASRRKKQEREMKAA